MANNQGSSGGKWIAGIIAFLTILASIAAIGSFIVDFRSELRAIKSENIKTTKELISAKQSFDNQIEKLNKEVTLISNVRQKFNDIEKIVIEENQLNELAKNTDIQALFSPFLEKGFQMIKFVPSVRWYRANERDSLSFARLKEYGVFENYKILLEVATHSENDRPPWRIPTNEDEWKELRRRFELFKNLAPIWVKMGILSR